jgi:folate receptor
MQVSTENHNERVLKVPLCQSDCDAWFNACVDDYTCIDNWTKNWTWSKQGNHCPKGTECKTFKDMYGTAENFCEKVFYMQVI